MNNTAHAATVIAAAVSGGAAAALSGNLDIRAVNFRYRE
jgi:hypothetical protein